MIRRRHLDDIEISFLGIVWALFVVGLILLGLILL